jgi:hypothetical protein
VRHAKDAKANFVSAESSFCVLHCIKYLQNCLNAEFVLFMYNPPDINNTHWWAGFSHKVSSAKFVERNNFQKAPHLIKLIKQRQK